MLIKKERKSIYLLIFLLTSHTPSQPFCYRSCSLAYLPRLYLVKTIFINISKVSDS